MLDPDPNCGPGTPALDDSVFLMNQDPVPDQKMPYVALLQIRIRNPGSGAFLTPGSGIRDRKKSRARIRDRGCLSRILFLRIHFNYYQYFGLKLLKFFDADPDSQNCFTTPGGLRQINTCCQDPLQVNFDEKPTFMVWCLYRYLVHGFHKKRCTVYADNVINYGTYHI